MKIKILSDLHLEINDKQPFHPGSGDVLILAGDILTAKHLNADGKLGEQYRQFLKDCSENFNQVLYVAGNHEHYSYHVNSTHKDIRKHLPKNIYLMENNKFVLNDWIFIGMSFWTDFNNRNASDMFVVKQMINDYRYIRTGPNYRKLLPEDVLELHLNSRKYLEEQLRVHKNDNVFVITHHAPSVKSIHDRFKGNVSNAAYYTEMSDLILNNSQIKYWISGHTHHCTDYMIGNCRCICNARGYYLYEEANGFNADLEIEV